MSTEEKKQETIEDLIEILKTKNPKDVVEYVVCKLDSEIVTCKVSARTAKPMIKMLKLFS